MTNTRRKRSILAGNGTQEVDSPTANVVGATVTLTAAGLLFFNFSLPFLFANLFNGMEKYIAYIHFANVFTECDLINSLKLLFSY